MERNLAIVTAVTALAPGVSAWRVRRYGIVGGLQSMSIITVSVRSLAYWNDKRKLWSIDGGKYTLYIAASGTDIHAVRELNVPNTLDIPASFAHR
jgi:hypothetical protein